MTGKEQGTRTQLTPAYGVYTWGKNTSAYYNSKHGHHEMAQAEGGH